MGKKQSAGWKPPEDAILVEDTNKWTPPEDAILVDESKKKVPLVKSLPELGLGPQEGYLSLQASSPEQQIASENINVEPSIPRVNSPTDPFGIGETVIRQLASGFSDQIPKSFAQATEVGKSFLQPGSMDEFIKQNKHVDFQRYVREHDPEFVGDGGILDRAKGFFTPFDIDKHLPKWRDQFIQDESKVDLSEFADGGGVGDKLQDVKKRIEGNAPAVRRRRLDLEEYVQQQNRESAAKIGDTPQSYKDIDSITDGVRYATNLAAQGLWQIPLTIATKGASGLVMESASVYDNQIQELADKNGISREEVIAKGLDKPAEGQLYAALAAGLDKFSAGGLMNLVKKGGVPLLKTMLSVTTETLTEPLQGALEETGGAVGAGGSAIDAFEKAWTLNLSRRLDEAAGGILGSAGPTIISAVNDNGVTAPEGDLGAQPQVQEQTATSEFTPPVDGTLQEEQVSPETKGIPKDDVAAKRMAEVEKQITDLYAKHQGESEKPQVIVDLEKEYNTLKEGQKIPVEKIFKLPIEEKVGKSDYISQPVEETVSIDKIAPSQKDISKNYVKNEDPNYIPSVTKVGDKYIVDDGHHRIANEILSGAKDVKVKVKFTDEKEFQDALTKSNEQSITPENVGGEIGTFVDTIVPQNEQQQEEQVSEGEIQQSSEPVGSGETETAAPVLEEDSGKKKTLLNRAYEGVTKDDVKASIAKHGLTYQPESHIHAKENANAFIKDVGFDKALDAVRKNQVDDGAAAFVWANLIDDVGSRISESTDENETSKLIELETELLSEFDNKARSGGRFISALREVYDSSDFGYKAEKQISDYKEKNKGEISPEIEERFKALEKELNDIKAKYKEAEAKSQDKEGQKAVDDIKESIDREKKQKTKTAQKISAAKSERAKLKKEFLNLFNPSKSGGQVNAMVIPGATLAIYGVKIANTYIKEGVARAEDIIARTKEYFEKELGYKLSDKETESVKEAIDKRLDEIDEKEGRVRVSHKLIRKFVEDGVKDINELVAKIKESIKDRHPDVTDREIRDVITGYGKVVNPSKDKVETDIRKMVRIGRIISAMEDVAIKKRPLKSGKQRDKLDADERALNKELNAALRDLPIDEETQTEQLKTSLDAVKSRLKNHIEDLNREIETGRKSAKAKGVEYDAEAKALEAERDQVKEIHDAIFYKRDDDATKIENVLAATQKAIDNITKRIDTNDLESRKTSKVTSPDIKNAQERLGRLRDRLKALQEDAGIPQRKRLHAAKLSVNKRIEDLRDRLETSNFAKKPKPEALIKDDELTKLEGELARVKEEFNKEQHKAELKNRTKAQKAIDIATEVWGLSRALRATGEFSFVLIQNWVYTQAHPVTAAKAVKTAFSHFISPAKSEAFINAIRGQEYYPRLKASKLAISETDVKMTAREEMFISSWGAHLWDLLGYPLTPWKPAYEAWKNVNPLRAFERAGTGFLNTVRVTRYIEGEEMLRMQGRNFKDHPQEYKDMADVINTFTGRASLGAFERISKPLAVVFFSPRNWASIIKQATPYAFYHFGKMTTKEGKVSVAQKMAISDYLTAIGTTTILIMMADFGIDDEDKKKHDIHVEKDPRSSDFMKLRFGKTRIDPWGGRQSMIVLQARLLMNSIKNEKGMVNTLGDKKTSTGVELMGKIAKNKLAPSTALAYKFLGRKTKNILGQEVWVDEFGNELFPDPENNLFPIYAETVSQLYEEQPILIAHLITFMAFWGLNTQSYDAMDMKKKKLEFENRKAMEIIEDMKD